MDDELKRRLWLMAAGLAGGFITLTTSKEDMTSNQKVAYLLSALLVALFITPWVCEYFNVTSPSAISGLGFFMGAFWQVVVVRGGELIKSWRMPAGDKHE